jgi:hypothetical protein
VVVSLAAFPKDIGSYVKQSCSLALRTEQEKERQGVMFESESEKREIFIEIISQKIDIILCHIHECSEQEIHSKRP